MMDREAATLAASSYFFQYRHTGRRTESTGFLLTRPPRVSPNCPSRSAWQYARCLLFLASAAPA